MLLVPILIIASIYAFFAYCLMRICAKAGASYNYLFLCWVPLFQWVPMFDAADIKFINALLLLIPGVNLIVIIWVWVKLFNQMDKSPWLCSLLFIPGVNVFYMPYLAFSD